MSKFKSVLKKAALVSAICTATVMSTLVANTGLNINKSNDALNFYLDSGKDINKANELYKNKWENGTLGIVSKANNSLNDVLAKGFGTNSIEVDFGKIKLDSLSDSAANLKKFMHENQNQTNEMKLG